MAIEVFPDWLKGLAPEDLPFVRNFILCSGSLKDLAQIYGVSYPTVRLRLDRLIAKIPAEDSAPKDPFALRLQDLLLKGQITAEAAKILIQDFQALRQLDSQEE